MRAYGKERIEFKGLVWLLKDLILLSPFNLRIFFLFFSFKIVFIQFFPFLFCFHVYFLSHSSFFFLQGWGLKVRMHSLKVQLFKVNRCIHHFIIALFLLSVNGVPNLIQNLTLITLFWQSCNHSQFIPEFCFCIFIIIFKYEKVFSLLSCLFLFLCLEVGLGCVSVECVV